jgi:hypothetical protein
MCHITQHTIAHKYDNRNYNPIGRSEIKSLQNYFTLL